MFEIRDEMRVLYSYSYGGISPFFEALAASAEGYQVSRCTACDLQYCPPRTHCQQCWSATEWMTHPGTGTIESLVWAYWIPIDSPARRYVQLPYAYGAIRLDGCRNLLRTRIVGVGQDVDLSSVLGVRGQLHIIDTPTGALGDVYFDASGRTKDVVR